MEKKDIMMLLELYKTYEKIKFIPPQQDFEVILPEEEAERKRNGERKHFN